MKSEGMTYEERQEFFRLKHIQIDEKAWKATLPEREAKMDKKRKDREWKEKSQVIEAIFRKPDKLFQKERKEARHILEEKFPITETTGELKDQGIFQILHLKNNLHRHRYSLLKKGGQDAKLVCCAGVTRCTCLLLIIRD
jgi:hypothetical protein